MWTTGTYRRGRRRSRLPVKVDINAAGLTVIAEDGETTYFTFAAMTARRSRDGSLRIERGNGSRHEVLLLGDPKAIEEVNLYAPHLLGGWRLPSRKAAAVVVVLLLVLVPAGYFWFYPLLVQSASGMVPAEVERKVGQAMLDANAPEKNQCTDPVLNSAVQNLADRLATTLPPTRTQLRYHIVITDLASANAFPLPGGSIVLHRGMIVRAATPETLAGVLAHQIQHLESHHPEEVIFHKLAWQGLLSIATGSVSGRAAKLAASIGPPAFGDAQESVADAGAIRMMLAAGFDPRGFILFYKQWSLDQEGLPVLAPYRASHPGDERRALRLEGLAGQTPLATGPPLDQAAWKNAILGCH